MRILYLPLKKEPYGLIEDEIKPEEYRAFKPYWITRLLKWAYLVDGCIPVEEHITANEAQDICEEGLGSYRGLLSPRDYDAVNFSYGYTKKRMLWECTGITFGRGRKEWLAPDEETFIIKLGRRLE